MIDKLIQIYTPDNWRTHSAADIATALSAPATLQPMTLIEFQIAAAQAGGNPEKMGELGNTWGGNWMNRASDALEAGRLIDVAGLIQSIPAADKALVGAESLAAIGAVIAGATLNAGDTQSEFTAQDVTDALTAAGYVWSDGQWQYGG